MDWTFLVGRGKKNHKKLRFIFIRNGKGQKDQNTKREERGRGEGGGRIRFRTRPVGAAEKRLEKNGLGLQTVTSAGLHKRPGQHTLHTRANTNTPHRVSRRAPGGPDPALARRDTMCCNYAISENSRRPSRALSTVTFILYFCKDLVPGCGWGGMGNRERKGAEDGQGGKRQEEGWMGRRGG